MQLLRSGALQEAQSVTFEISTDGVRTFGTPVAATRIAGGWQISQVNLGSFGGVIRTRVRTVGGVYDGSGGLLGSDYPFTLPAVAVYQPVNNPLLTGTSTVDFGERPSGGGSAGTSSLAFSVSNPGGASTTVNLTSLDVDGTNATDFTLDRTGLGSTLVGGASGSFVVRFTPQGAASGFRNAVLHVRSSVNGVKSASFDVKLTGLGLSTTSSTGGDGLNDHAKYLLSALGFDWTQSQPALVQAYYNGANAANLYTTAQVQALNVGTPLIQRNASTGQFTLTIAVQQSANLQTYTPLSLSTGTATINQAGALEFSFTSPSGAAFYRVQSQ